MEAILLVVHVVIAIALIGVVLIQRSDQDGFGLGSGSGSNFMTGRQSANLLTRSTAVLAGLFMLNSMVLTILAAERSDLDIVDRIEAARSAPDVPTNTTSDDDNDEALPDGTDALPEVPAATQAPKSDDAPVSEPVAPQASPEAAPEPGAEQPLPEAPTAQ